MFLGTMISQPNSITICKLPEFAVRTFLFIDTAVRNNIIYGPDSNRTVKIIVIYLNDLISKEYYNNQERKEQMVLIKKSPIKHYEKFFLKMVQSSYIYKVFIRT